MLLAFVPSPSDGRTRSLCHLTVLVVLLLCACSQRFVEIRTIETSQGIAFEVQEIAAGLKKDQAYELLDLTVMRRDCVQDCTMWFVVRERSQMNRRNLDATRIVYGREPKGMILRTRAKALPLGSYSVSATLQQYNATGEFIKSILLDGVFSIYQDESGNQRVSRELQEENDG